MGTTLALDGRPKLRAVLSFVNEEQEVFVIVRSAPAASSKIASLDRATSAAESSGEDSFGQTLDQLLANSESAPVATDPGSNTQDSTRTAESNDSQQSAPEADSVREDAEADTEVRTETSSESDTTDSEPEGETNPETEPEPVDDPNADEEVAELPRSQDEISIEALLAEIRAAQGEEVVRAPLAEVPTTEPATTTDAATAEVPSDELTLESELPTAKLPNPAEGSASARPAIPSDEAALPNAPSPASEAKSEAPVEPTRGTTEHAESQPIEEDAATDEVAATATKDAPEADRTESKAKAVDQQSAELAARDAKSSSEEATPADDVTKVAQDRASENVEAKGEAKRDDSNSSERHRDGKAAREAAKPTETIVPDLERAARQAERAILEQGKVRVETRPTEMTRARGERAEAIVEPKGNVEPSANRAAQTSKSTEPTAEPSVETKPAATGVETAAPTTLRRDDALLRLDPALSKLERALEPAGTPTIVQWNPATMRADATPAAFASGTVAMPVPLAAIYSQIKSQLQTGAQELKIRLDPPALGQLNLRFVVDGDTIAVHVRATRPEVVEALKNDLAGFSDTLRENGIDLSKLEISLDERSPSDARQSFQEQMEHADGVADEEATQPTSQSNQRSPVEPAGERSALLDIMA